VNWSIGDFDREPLDNGYADCAKSHSVAYAEADMKSLFAGDSEERP